MSTCHNSRRNPKLPSAIETPICPRNRQDAKTRLLSLRLICFLRLADAVTTILIAAQPDDVRAVLPWAQLLAQATDTGLTIVLAQRRKGDPRLVAVPEEPEDGESELVAVCREMLAERVANVEPAQVAETSPEPEADEPVQIRQLLGDAWADSLPQQLAEFEPSTVIVPAPTISKDQSLSDDWQTHLLGGLECEVILVQDGVAAIPPELRLAVVLRGTAGCECVLERAAQLVAAAPSSSATAVYVQPGVGDLAVSVGMKSLGHLLRETLNRYECDDFERRVIVSDSLSDAVQQLHDDKFDLILTEASQLSRMRRFLASGSGSSERESTPALAVVRPAQSLTDRLWSRLGRRIRSVVPQLSREDRVNLVSRIEASSQWDFDFVFLVSLATLIACLGLAEDSGAVIVGAMLVAPLMTPIAGVGLGVAHGNAFLTRVALRTALRGFATAMVIGVVFGFCVQVAAAVGWLESLQSPAEGLTVYPGEMEQRTHPQFYDLLIALASGVAAAYAMGRPNLFAALPGVAIAAALVPPVATSGIALSHGDIAKGAGALLLFVTNMVTIILGTSLVFRAVGVHTQKEGQSAASWPKYSLLLLVILSILVTVMMELIRAARG